MDIASMAPALSIFSLKFRLFPLRKGPNPSDWTILEGREGLLSFTFFSTRGDAGDVPWPLSHPSVQHQSEEGAFPAHSRAAPHPCSSPTLLLSIIALLQIFKPQPHSPQPCSGTASSGETTHVQIQTCFSGWSPTHPLSQTLGLGTCMITAKMGKISFSSAFWWQCISSH